jgi:hypothetical protein
VDELMGGLGARNASIPEGELSAAWTTDAILGQARTLASTLDPHHAATYRSMSRSRWLQAGTLGTELLVTHAAYRLHHARGRGRRQHAAEMHTLLDEANGANLIAALALLFVMGRMLDQVPRGT